MMSPTRLVGVVGGSGFIGSAVVDALIVGGCSVQVVRSPRLPRMSPSLATRYVESGPRVLDELIDALERCDVVINAAGSAHAASRDLKALTSANAAVPAIVAAAARAVGAKRYVHVSSAAVQGRRQVLDASRHYDPFSDYSRSKVLGEDLVDKYASDIAVVYRPPSVHGVGRSQTRSVARFAASPLGSVAGPGTSPSPQALVGNIGSAVAFLATTTQQPPSIVSHPWEGLTVADVMELRACPGSRRT